VAGETILLRYFDRGPGRPTGALPTRAVSTDNAPALWVASGTTVKWPGIAGRPLKQSPEKARYTQPLEVIDRPWTGDGVLILGRPGHAHSIWLFWENWRFIGWYVQLEDPWRPSRLGFDTKDHTLDIWIDSDGSWRWKDDHELEVAVEVGFFTSEQAAAFRAEGERVIAEWPFPTGWEDWRADPSWPIPSLPGGWEA
jgi:uncharacterized protein